MASESLKVIVGIIAILVGIFVLIGGFSYVTTTCTTGPGMTENCTTDIGSIIISLVMMGIGIVIGAGGIRTAWKNW